MKIKFFLFLLIFHSFLFGSLALAEKDKGWPKTVEEAVTRIIYGFSEEDKVYVAHIPKELLPKLHFTLGMGIRNSFGLRAGNTALIEDCGCQGMHTDEVSSLIIRATWKRLRSGMDPDYLRRVDQTHEKARSITISPFSYEGVPLIKILEGLNQEISKLTNGLLIELNGIDLGKTKVSYDEEEGTPLHLVLLRLELHSGLKMVNYPNRVVFSSP